MTHPRRIAVALLMALLGTTAAFAQKSSDAAKEINRIKTNKDYLYAEATMKDEAEALSGAQAILEMTVKDWMASQKKSGDADAYIIKAKQSFTPIQTMRGQYHRAFVYVKKSDIIPVEVGGSTMVVTTNKPATEVAAQPVAKKPVVAETAPAEAGKVTTVATVEDLKAAVTLTPEEKELAAIRKGSEIEPKVKALESAGKATAYGSYKEMPATGVCYMLVYDRGQNVVATLRRDADGEQLNLNTLQADDIKNYKGCGAIWVQLRN